MDTPHISKTNVSTETSNNTDDTSSSSTDTLLESADTNVEVEHRDSEPEIVLKSSKSNYATKNISSADESEEKSRFEPKSILKSTKSQYILRVAGSSDDESGNGRKESIDNSNLQKGNVFVYMVIPPDGGYGWFITFISFLCQIVVDGIIFGIGIILPHIAKEFNVAGSKVILIASMQIGFYFLSGTISSAFINKFGFRLVASAGCVISIITLSIATYSTNLLMMLIFYSILGGPGLSMIWVSSQLIIGYYFERYRPIANGIACSGAGVGLMMFSYMNSALVAQLGWRNLMRVHVGFLIMVLLMGLTYTEVAPTRIGRVKEMLVADTDSDSIDLITDMTNFARFSIKPPDKIDDNYEKAVKFVPKKESSYNCLNKCCTSCYRCFKRHRDKKAPEATIKRYVIKQDLIDRPDFFYMGPVDRTEEDEKQDEEMMATSYRSSISNKLEEFHTISLDDLDNNYPRHSIIKTLSTMHINRDQQERRFTFKELKQTEQRPLLAFLHPKNLIHPKIQRAFSLLFDFRLLAIREFRILLLSAFLFPMGFNIPFVYSTVRVQIDPSFAKLISPIIGFSNFAFRIASGFVAFKFREYTTYICGGGMFFGGISVFVSAFYGLDVVWFQFVYAMCYGMAPAFYSTLRAIIYVRSLGLDKLTNAFGLTALAMGLGVFIGTTTGGILNDFTASYTASFIFAGLCFGCP